MKTKILFLIFNFSFLIFHFSSSQVTFQKTYGGNKPDAAFKLAKTYDGGYALCGATVSFGPLPQDAYFFKTDGNGMHLWSVVFQGSGSDFVISVTETSDHGFLIAGGTSSFGAGSDDGLLIRTDSTGAPIWSKVYGGPQQDYFLNAIQTTDGGFIAVG